MVKIIKKWRKSIEHSKSLDMSLGSMTKRCTEILEPEWLIGIKNTNCCLAFLTEEYHQKVVYGRESDNCKSEFDFASTTVPIRAVVLEDSMKNPHTWEGNIAITLKIKLYVDMSEDVDDREYFEEKMQQLKKELDKIISPSVESDTKQTVIQVDENDVLSEGSETEKLKNLAYPLFDAEKYEEAIPNLELLVTKQSSSLGHSHSDTLVTLQKLACCYKETEEFEKAISTYEDLIAKQTLVLGKTNHETLSTKCELAYCFQYNGKKEKAIKICEELIGDRTSIFGVLHPGTLEAIHRYASCLIAKDLEKATSIFEELVENRKSVLGPMDKETLCSMHSYASCLFKKNEFQRAISICETVVEKRLKVLGPTHKKTISSMYRLWQCFEKSKNFNRAIACLKTVVEMTKSIKGDLHEKTLKYRFELGRNYYEKREKTAIPILRDVVIKQLSLLGDTHKDTVKSKYYLGKSFYDFGDLDTTIFTFEDKLAKGNFMENSNHIDMFDVMDMLARSHRKKLNIGRAKVLFKELVDRRTASLGANHEKHYSLSFAWPIVIERTKTLTLPYQCTEI
ncbi:nephrocystin-3-like [Clytia hemisphaerica]|uniref:Uncharacterized protein n=1 Tax=Clytia hemisphaerica TaxID=252671 RepID=A0A7M5WWQ8_9CNID